MIWTNAKGRASVIVHNKIMGSCAVLASYFVEKTMQQIFAEVYESEAPCMSMCVRPFTLQLFKTFDPLSPLLAIKAVFALRKRPYHRRNIFSWQYFHKKNSLFYFYFLCSLNLEEKIFYMICSRGGDDVINSSLC